MKRFKLFILAIICCVQLHAQEQKMRGAWSINAIMSHYEPQKANDSYSQKIGYNVNPGIEVLYGFPMDSFIFLSTGISCQYLSIESHREGADKFVLGELSIPLLFTAIERSGHFSFTTGFYSGQFLHFSWYHDQYHQWELVNLKDEKRYSDKSFFMDGYLDFGYSNSSWFTNDHVIKIVPFMRYRFSENWMEYYRTSVYYGIKFSLTFKTKER